MAPDRHDARRGERSTPGAAPDGPGARPHGGCPGPPERTAPDALQDLPPLPAAYTQALDAGLDAIGLALEPAARAVIDAHVRLLLAWTEAINLTAIREPADVARLHVLDSLSAVPPLAALGIDGLLDIGSGGGFPGLPLAAALAADRTLLVDSVGKKVRFLQTVVAATGLGGSPRNTPARRSSPGTRATARPGRR